MPIQKSSTQQTPFILHDENILVIRRELLFRGASFQGLAQVDFDHYLATIQREKEFLPRAHMETDPRYKQIIPYLIFEHNDRYFLMQRQAKASEQRLQSKLTLGIGGHIRQEDMSNDSSIADWAHREFHEEVDFTGSFSIKPIGIINDDSNEVGKVHLGFVFLLHGDNDCIKVKSELKSGELLTLQECLEARDRMETWSQIIIDHLAISKG